MGEALNEREEEKKKTPSQTERDLVPDRTDENLLP
jgi:hypothetical protein